jgi:hypothetical protein
MPLRAFHSHQTIERATKKTAPAADTALNDVLFAVRIAMKSQTRLKMYRDQALFRDLSFLLLAAGFILVQMFDLPLQSALLYAPVVVFGGFVTLVGGAHVLLGLFRLLDAIGNHLGMGSRRN